MSKNSAMFVFITGLLLTLMGAGGIEQSITNSELLSSVAVSCVGLLVMWVGTLGFKRSDAAYAHATRYNSTLN